MSGAIPESYWSIIEPMINTARGFLEKGEKLAPIAFVGSFISDVCIPILLRAGSDELKDKSAIAIKKAADGIKADYIFTVMEAWSLRKDKLAQMDAIRDKYGSIGASPYALDVVSLALETRHGVWMAEVPIKPKGISKKKRTFDKPEFRHFNEYSGRFVNLLPVKAPSSGLH